MSQQKEEILQKLLLNTLIFENLLKTYKTEFYREIIEHKKCVIEDILSSNLTLKQKESKVRALEAELKILYKRVKRTETIGLEITRDFNKIVSDFDFESFVEDTSDIYIPFTHLLMKLSKESSISTIIPAILVEDKNGTIVQGNTNYKLLI